jgi:hypothetical protein
LSATRRFSDRQRRDAGQSEIISAGQVVKSFQGLSHVAQARDMIGVLARQCRPVRRRAGLQLGDQLIHQLVEDRVGGTG